MGDVLRQLTETEQAIQVYQRALELKPQTPGLHARMGKVYYEMKRYDEAVKEYQEEAALQPEDPEVQYNLGIAYYAAKDRSGCQTQIERLKTLNEEYAARLVQYCK
jgi:Flp pilus assembly protein TadD